MSSQMIVSLLSIVGISSFVTQSQSAGLDFLVMGDWGGQPDSPYYTPDEKDSASVMGTVASNHDIKFVMALGDNFYDSGVTDVDDPRFKETFEDVFTASTLTDIPFYVVAGNHDHYGNASAQVAYTNSGKSTNNRWQFPSYYYTKSFNIPDTSYTLDIIMIDTVILCGNTVDSYEYCYKHGLKPNTQKCSLKPMGPEDQSAADEEWKWLNETISSSTADFIIVAGHYPIYSIAEHGPTALLVDKLKPILLENNVQLYMNGHDHTMEYIQETDNSDLGYVTTGAAHVCDDSTAHKNEVPKDSLLYHDCNKGGFVRVEIYSAGMAVYYYLSDSSSHQYATKTFAPRSKSKLKKA